MSKTSKVSFACTRAERGLIEGIVNRAKEAGYCQGKTRPDHWYDPLTMTMDLAATNANGCPMDFERMLAADDFNLLHDIAGIARHMDRNTGRLTDHFRPRFTRRVAP